MQSNCGCEQTWNMSRSREIGSQQLKPMKLYETKTIENAITQISAIGISDEKKNNENFRVKTNNAVWGVH